MLRNGVERYGVCHELRISADLEPVGEDNVITTAIEQEFKRMS